MSSNIQDMPCHAASCQVGASIPINGPLTTDPASVADLRGLDRAAGLVFAVLLALAALVVLDSAQIGENFTDEPHHVETSPAL